MKAVHHHEYGSVDVLELADVERPEPAKNDILIRVCASSLNPADQYVMTGSPYLVRAISGLRKPKKNILGRDFAGTVEAVGSSVTRFHPGDEVFGESESGGAFAEFLAVPETSAALKPANLNFEEAATVPLAGLTAFQGLAGRAGIRAGQKVLIHGSSGGVGTFAVQIAKAFDTHVTAVCSPRNAEMVQSIGADKIIDYTTTDYTTTGASYDLIFDLVLDKPLSAIRQVLAPDGVYVSAGAPPGQAIGPIVWMAKVLLASRRGTQTMMVLSAKANTDIEALSGLIEAGKVSPVVGRHFGLDEVSEAMQHQMTGAKQGKTVITI